MPISVCHNFKTVIVSLKDFKFAEGEYKCLYIKDVAIDQELVDDLLRVTTRIVFIDCDYTVDLHMPGMEICLYGNTTKKQIVITAAEHVYFCTVPAGKVKFVSADKISLGSYIPLSVVDRVHTLELSMSISWIDLSEVNLMDFVNLRSIRYQVNEAHDYIVNVPETCLVAVSNHKDIDENLLLYMNPEEDNRFARGRLTEEEKFVVFQRSLSGIESDDETVSENSQNVHTPGIEESALETADRLMTEAGYVNLDFWLKKHSLLNDVREARRDDSYDNLLRAVVFRIESVKDRDTKSHLVRRLREEIEDGEDTCIISQKIRLVNALVGFFDDIHVYISMEADANNTCILFKRLPEVEQTKEKLTEMLRDRGQSEKVVSDWTSFLTD